MPDPSEVLWTPPADARERTRVGRYLNWLAQHRGLRFSSYQELWEWSVQDTAAFWTSIVDSEGIRFHRPYQKVLAGDLPHVSWFTGGTLNYAEHALRLAGRVDDDVVLIGRSQTRDRVTYTAAQLRAAVGRARTGLRRLGVGRGDRVAAYLPNIPETIIAFLATASLGAIWSSCAPEFGARSVIDRFAQIEPTVLLTIDGYRYGDREIDRSTEVATIRAGLPTVTTTVTVPYLAGPHGAPLPGTIPWAQLLAEAGPTEFDAVPFGHPLYILYSSGTTGRPKAIVHGHGGILVEHLKTLALHSDLDAGDRFFWFTTTGWMMWNYLVSGLLVDSTLVLFDGDPGKPDLSTLWRMAAEERITYFGTSAPFLTACRRAGLRPGAEHDLSALRGVGSTGAPLPPEAFRWVYDAVAEPAGTDLLLASVSGGTDVCTAFVGASPLVEVWAGEISCRCLGAAVEAWDAQGRPVIGIEGELVITRPMPSMPVGFWGDADGARYRATYFEQHPGVWTHGDWITISERGSCVISGRSDATLNRGGVRVGTAEYYSVIESLPEISDALVVHSDGAAGRPDQLWLFLAPAQGMEIDDELRRRLSSLIRRELSPRHVPDRIVSVPSVPRTLSGKRLEVPVKRVLGGGDPEQVASRGSLADPTAWDAIVRIAEDARQDETRDEDGGRSQT